jgi:error-prone DNA polymerase
MAAWRRQGSLEPFEEKLIAGMRERHYSPEFAQQICSQIRGFGEYGFPESHAASFALLVYVSAWLKAHEPAAFTCALLNSQPMGFYAPAQLLRNVRRSGVEVRPVDVNRSQWESTLEGGSAGQPALRLGCAWPVD